MKIKFIDPEGALSRAELQDALPADVISFEKNLEIELFKKIIDESPDIIFLIGFENEDQLSTLLRNLSSLTKSILVPEFNNPNASTLLSMMQLGVTEILLKRNNESILEKVNLLKLRLIRSAKIPQAQCLAFMSAKGGDGGTCVAANFAYGLAERSKDLSILAIDLSLPFGDLEMYLTSQLASHDLSDVAAETERLDSSLLDSMVQKVTDNLHLIGSPRDFSKILSINPGHIEALVNMAKHSYDYIIFDIGAGVDPISVQILEKLDYLLIVTTLTVPSVRRSGQLLNLWDTLGYSQEKVSIIVNRHNEISELHIKDLEKVIARPVFKVLPYDPEGIQESLLKGIPSIKLNPKAVFSRVMAQWAGDFHGEGFVSDTKKGSLWHRLKSK